MNLLEKLGSLGAIVAAFGMSCSLPLFATVGSVKCPPKVLEQGCC